MFNPQMTSSQMELLPLVCLCLLSWSGTTSADQPVPVTVEEGSDAILPCSFGVNIEEELLEWKKDGQKVFVYDAGLDRSNLKLLDDRFSHFKDELKHGNASLKIRNTKVADRGDYTCDTPHLQSSQTVHVKLFVGGELKDRTGENIPGAAPKPYITLHETKNEALLQCEAHGAPKLDIEWRDSDGNILNSKEQRVTGNNRIDISLNTTVTKTGTFYCVATQKNINHRISAKITVYIEVSEDKPQTDNTGWIVAAVLSFILTLLVVGVFLAVLVSQGCIKLNFKRGYNEAGTA